MNPLNRFKGNIPGNETEEENLVETIYIIMKEFSYTLNEIKEMPLPTFFLIVKMMNKENRKNKQSLGKIKR